MSTSVSTSVSMSVSEHSLAARSGPFLAYIEEWQRRLPAATLSQVAADPGAAAILCVDMSNGFCYEGALSSPRVAALAPPIARLLRAAYVHGLRHFIFLQDNHSQQAPEFAAYPPHCLAGTHESETIPELLALPFAGSFVVMPKNSVSPAIGTDLMPWVARHPHVTTYIVVGDCTDICVYQLAVYLKADANQANLARNVIVPANCSQTYDLPVEEARRLGALPHAGDLLHNVFLYHMALNGVQVVASVEEE